MKKYKVGIAGAAGYTGGELIRILLFHPLVELTYISSRTQAGKKVYEVHEDLIGQTELAFTEAYPDDLDILFICFSHGHSRAFLSEANFPHSMRIIDLSSDFRIKHPEHDYVYGLTELNRNEISKAKQIANPGCFATAIQLALLPLAAKGLLTNEVHISAITGSTGAGIKSSETNHFTWRNNNITVYKAFRHQHLEEINQSLKQLQPSFNQPINFIPYRGDFTRGIIATIYTEFHGSQESAERLYDEYYQNEKFVIRSKKNIHLKQVINTNNCLLYIEVINNKIMIISIIDNLLKGASGQAIQNMNSMMGWDESTGLQLKASVY